MRILFTCDYLGLNNPSGAGRYVLETGRALAARGHEVRILAGGEAEDPATDGKDGYPAITRFPFPASRHRARWILGGGLGRITLAARTLAADWKPTHLVLNQPLSGDAVPDFGIPATYLFHSPWGAEREGSLLRSLRDRIERRVLRRCGKAVVLSDFMRGELTKTHPGLELKVEKIPGGADLARFAYVAEPGGKRPTLLTVRRLVPRMGLELLIDAMALLRARYPEALLRIAGRGPLEPTLKLKVAQLALEPQVRLDGFLPEADLPAALGDADLFVMPSERLEGFGMVIPEALACGTPVLGSPVGAIPEVLGAFDPALVLPELSAQTLADGIASLLAQPGRLAALRPACRAHTEKHYGWDRAAERLEAFLA